MANDLIKITRNDTAAVGAQDILTASAQAAALLVTLQKITDRGYHLFSTGPDDFTGFEEYHGIPEGQGAAVFTLINGTRGVLRGEFQNANALDLISKIG